MAHDLAGTQIMIPALADYEVRRELLRRGAAAKLGRLDSLQAWLPILDVTSYALRKAADFWSLVRRSGVPTAHPEALDADAIVAGQAATVGGLGDMVTIATGNVRHLTRFPGIDARP